jgi:hypothetical protein
VPPLSIISDITAKCSNMEDPSYYGMVRLVSSQTAQICQGVVYSHSKTMHVKQYLLLSESKRSVQTKETPATAQVKWPNITYLRLIYITASVERTCFVHVSDTHLVTNNGTVYRTVQPHYPYKSSPRNQHNRK